jgi:hypothetical protein
MIHDINRYLFFISRQYFESGELVHFLLRKYEAVTLFSEKYFGHSSR